MQQKQGPGHLGGRIIAIQGLKFLSCRYMIAIISIIIVVVIITSVVVITIIIFISFAAPASV